MKRFLKIFAGIIVVFAGLWLVLASFSPAKEPKAYGVTFSAFYADRFEGVRWQDAYLAMLDNLGIKKLRLPAYWSEVEPIDDGYNFSRLDWQIREAEKRNVDVVLAVGRKLPRWPECHEPEWARGLPTDKQNEKLLDYIVNTVKRYDGSPAVKVWQVENEPFLPFGECAEFSSEFLDSEIALVRSLTEKPVMITDSGELSAWVRAAKRSDVFGSTMYRKIHTDRLGIGTFTYPLPASFFRVKRTITEFFVGKKPMVIIELQGESWLKKMTYELSVEEQYSALNPDEFKYILEYASRSGFDEFYLWGVEWWYWLKAVKDKPEMWDIAKTAIESTKTQ